jgi:hypothetical protein
LGVAKYLECSKNINNGSSLELLWILLVIINNSSSFEPQLMRIL